MRKQHIIKKQRIEIETDSRSKAFQMQNTMSRLYRDKLKDILDCVFSEMSGPDQLHRIDKMEIDVGKFTGQLTPTVFLRSFEQKLRQVLQQEKVLRENGNAYPSWGVQQVKKHKKERLYEEPDIETWYEQEGFEEEFFEEEGAMDLYREFLPTQVDLSPDKDDNAVGKWHKHRKNEDASSLNREKELVIYFLKTGVIPWWCDPKEEGLLERAISDNMDLLSAQVMVLMQADEGILKRVLYQFTEEQLAFLVENRPSDLGSAGQKVLRDIHQFLENTTGASLNSLKTRAWKVILGHSASELPTEEALIKEILETWKGLLHNIGSTKPKSLIWETGFFEQLMTFLSTEIRKNERGEIERDALKLKIPDQFPHIPKIHEQPFNDTESVHMANAGLALIARWVPGLLEKCALLNKEKTHFHSEEAQQKAVHLLQYLVKDALESPEYELVLNKILCGIDMQEAVECSVPLGKKERKQCRSTLKKALNSFPHLKGMTIGDFKLVFLQRNGILTTRNRHWLLRIETEGRDILLENFLWESANIHFPWMPDPIDIEWGMDYDG